MFQVKIMKVVRSLEQFFFSSFLRKASVQGKDLNPHVDVVVSAPSFRWAPVTLRRKLEDCVIGDVN